MTPRSGSPAAGHVVEEGGLVWPTAAGFPLGRDRDLVELARDVATEIIDADPLLSKHEGLRDEIDVLLTARDEEFLLKS